jgi:hypothetical protein
MQASCSEVIKIVFYTVLTRHPVTYGEMENRVEVI